MAADAKVHTPSEFAALPLSDQIKAVDDMAENMPYGVRPDRLEAYAGKSVWPFHADAGTGATKIYLADVQGPTAKNAPLRPHLQGQDRGGMGRRPQGARARPEGL